MRSLLPTTSARVAALAATGALAAAAAVAHAADPGGGHGAGAGAGHARDTTPDPDAPPGAKPGWLPNDAWVMHHWLPYDEARLLSLLDVDRRALKRWLGDGERTIAQLAARHGHTDREQLIDALLEPRRDQVDARTMRTLEERTEALLTQSHLAQHVHFHVFHDPQIRKSAERIFGVSPQELRALRREGRSPAQIAQRGGRSTEQAKAAVRSVLEAGQREGLRRRATTERQSEAMIALQRTRLERWIARSPKPRDATG